MASYRVAFLCNRQCCGLTFQKQENLKAASSLLLRDTFTKPQSKQNNNTNTSNDRVSVVAMENISMSLPHADTGSNCGVLLHDLCPHSQSCRVLNGHLMNSWERYLIGFQAQPIHPYIVCLFMLLYSYMNDLVSFGSDVSLSNVLTAIGLLGNLFRMKNERANKEKQV